MDQAFILPLPKSQRAPGFEELEASQKKPSTLRFLRRAFDKLRAKRMEWAEFFQKIDPTDPILRLATTKEGNTILHLAVFADVKDLPLQIAKDPVLLWKRNHYGLTPVEIAQFLKRDILPLHKLPGLPPSFEGVQPSLQSYPESFSLLTHPIFENEQVLYSILSRTQKAKMKDRIPPEKTWMGVYFDKEIQQGLHPPVSIRFIDKEVGYGVFVQQKISSCSFVGEYSGKKEKAPQRKKVLRALYCLGDGTKKFRHRR